MNIHINQKMLVLIVIAHFVLGALIGGCVGGYVGKEMGEHRGGWDRQDMMSGYDNQRDGEYADDNGGAPNSDEMATGTKTTGSAVRTEIKNLLK